MAGACLNSELQNLSWVALQVRPRSEKFVTSALTFKGIETFLPLYTSRRRWSDRVKELELPLFGGYVFCKLDLQYRMPALLVPNVIQFVGFGKTPVAIEESEITALKAVVNSGLPSMPWPFLQIGQKVRVKQGPLRDLEGILLQVKGSDRLVLSVSLLQRSVAVEVDRDSVTPVTPRQRPLEPAILTPSAGF